MSPGVESLSDLGSGHVFPQLCDNGRICHSPLQDSFHRGDSHFCEDKKVVKRSQMKICHCLGVSGSCTKQVCIKGLRRHSGKIEANMHALFQSSKLVQLEPLGSQQPKRKAGLVLRDPKSASRNRRVRKKFLVYSSKPPDFCSGNRVRGFYGVQGRQCNITSGDGDGQLERVSCAHLCCGRYNFEATYQVRQEWCNCQILYNPIKVDCQLCEKRVLQHRCHLYRLETEP